MYSKKKKASSDLDVLDRKWKVMLKAKEHISDDILSNEEEYLTNKYEFICHAVSWVVNKNIYSRIGIAGSIRRDITGMLFPYNALSIWLIDEKNISASDVNDNPHKLQATRMAWVNWMIEDYKSRDE